jgi:hypothetical protein
MAANKRQAQLLSRIFDGASVEAGGENRDGVTIFSIHGLEGNWRLRGIWAGEGWPADVGRILDRFSDRPLPRDLVITARALSPGARELLNAHEANWADEQGNARIRGQGLLIVRDAPLERAGRSEFSWSPSALAVAEALLARDWSEGVSTGDLARIVDWSPPQVSQVLGAFDEKGWTVKYGAQRGPSARRELNDQEDLLHEWSRQVAGQERNARLTHRTLRDPFAFLSGELSGALGEEVRWAVGGWAAAYALAPFVDSVPSLQIYVHEDDFGEPLDRVVSSMKLMDAAEGGRVAFIPAPSSVLSLGEQKGALPLVSPPRVYADLLAFGGRGLDAAEHLQEEVLENLHSAHRQPPAGLVDWERSCRSRLRELTGGKFAVDPYSPGAWSASYRVLGTVVEPSLQEMAGMLREVKGRETGWPAWWAPAGGENRPRPFNGNLECWMRDMLPARASEADYWRADPKGRLCLIRAYQEDAEMDLEPGSVLDLTLPIWRTGECLLHAERMAHRLEGDRVQMMMRWTGLRGRRLGTPASPQGHGLPGEYLAAEDEVLTFVQADPEEIRADLAHLVRRLVNPLFESFDLFSPPEGTYEEELERLRANDF